MSAVADFSKRYGPIMTAYVLLGCGLWLIGLIVLPQILMIQRPRRRPLPRAPRQRRRRPRPLPQGAAA